MKNCKICKKGKLKPVGRTQLMMLDGGVIEQLVAVCGKCWQYSFERPSVKTKKVDDYDPNAPELRMLINPAEYTDG